MRRFRFEDDITGLVLIALAVAVAVFIVVGIVLEVRQEAQEPPAGIVVDKDIEQGSTTYIKSGDVLVPITSHDQWVIYFEDDGRQGDCEVSHGRYELIEIGDWFVCED